jgi:hypothetical protein
LNLTKAKRRRRKRRSPFKIDPLCEEVDSVEGVDENTFHSSRGARIRSNRLRNVIGLCMLTYRNGCLSRSSADAISPLNSGQFG